MTYDPNDPNRAFEYPSLEQSGHPVDPSAPIDYPATNPSGYPQPPGYPPATGYPGPAFPSPYQPHGTPPHDPYRLGVIGGKRESLRIPKLELIVFALVLLGTTVIGGSAGKQPNGGLI